MCGIAGIYNFNKEPVLFENIKNMTDSIKHRGPDGEGQFLNENLGLGHRRLSIIDLSDAGKQPMNSSNGRYIITYNGEIYNYKKIKLDLQNKGYRFFSNTDTEVIINAFIEWKEECVKLFNGMFAFAIWDKEKKKLFIARDRFGVKPLYYYKNDQTFIFASEIKGIISSGKYKPTLDKNSLVEYLTFQNFFTNKTLFKDIFILKAGNYAYVNEENAFKEKQFWDFNFQSSLKITKKEATEELRRLFKQSIKRQLIGDVPINSYLSGGLDSGAITFFANKILKDMKSFTIGFEMNSVSGLELSFDEREKAEYMSYLSNTEHYEMVLKAGDLERCMDKYTWHLEEPRVGQSYPNFYAAKLASKFGKVILSGCGGDELFAGYPWRYFYSKKNISFNEFVNKYYKKWQRLLPNQLLSQLLYPINKDIKKVWTKGIFEDVLLPIKKENLNKEDLFNASLYFEAKTFLHGLLVIEDKLSMAHSLETRVPFLDNDLVDFAQKIPPKFKITNKTIVTNENNLNKKIASEYKGKKILKDALKDYFNKKVLDNKKQGFSSPDASWFKGESIDFIKKALKNSKLGFNKKIITNILNEHTLGKKNNRLIIWSLMYLTFFIEKFNVKQN